MKSRTAADSKGKALPTLSHLAHLARDLREITSRHGESLLVESKFCHRGRHIYPILASEREQNPTAMWAPHDGIQLGHSIC